MDTKKLKQLAGGCVSKCSEIHKPFASSIGFSNGKAIITNGKFLLRWAHGEKSKAKPFCINANDVKKFDNKSMTKIKRSKIINNDKEFIDKRDFPFEIIEKIITEASEAKVKHKVGLKVATIKELLRGLDDDVVLTFEFNRNKDKAIPFHNQDKSIDGLLMPCRID